MRVILNGFQSTHMIPVLNQIVSHFSPKFIGTIDACDQLFFSKSCNVRHHDFRKIMNGHYPIPEYQLAPLDAQLISDMAACETTVLRMMDRMHPIYNQDYSGRKRIYLRHLRYWNDFIQRHEITHFLSTNVPHEMTDYCIYSLCQKKGLKSSHFFQTMLNDACVVQDDFRLGPEQVAHELFSAPVEEICLDEIKLSPKFETHFRAQADKTRPAAPFYMSINRNQLAQIHSKRDIVKRAVHRLRGLTPFLTRRNLLGTKELKALYHETIDRFLVQRQLLKLDQILWSQYERLCTAPDFNAKYIYVPLHFQPEATTCPMGGAFVDQVLLVAQLAAEAPPNYLIYVKEHPNQRCIGRSPQFYHDLAEYPNVRLVSKRTSTFELIRNSTCVATVTGTAGWEALFWEKPVLFFGWFMYQYVPGILQIRNLEDCRKAFALIENGFKPKLGAIKRYLSALDKHSIHGYSDASYASVSSNSIEENARILSEGLIAHLEKQSMRNFGPTKFLNHLVDNSANS